MLSFRNIYGIAVCVDCLINTVIMLKNNVVAVSAAASAAVVLSVGMCTVVARCYYRTALGSIDFCEFDGVVRISLYVYCLVVTLVKLCVALEA